MTVKRKVLALCGSTRKASSNLNLIKAIALIAKKDLEISIFDELDLLPHYNPDLDNETPPEEVSRFRKLIRAAAGVLICTPEYAMGVPGSLKNALDWTVSSMEFSGKPVLAITASTSGEKAHQSLMGTLNIIEAKTEGTELLISFIKTKVNNAYITDADTLKKVESVLETFITTINENVIY